jgi:hypothetical protein
MRRAEIDREGHYLHTALISPTHPLGRGLVKSLFFNSGFPVRSMERLQATSNELANGGFQQADVIPNNGEGPYYHFDGTTSYIIITTPLGIASTNQATILMRAYYTQTTDMIIMQFDHLTSDFKFGFEIGNPNLGRFITTGATNYAQITAAVATGWHNYAFVFNGTLAGNAARIECWLDGTLPAVTYVGTIPAASPAFQRLWIGRTAGGTYKSCYITQILIYNRALVPVELDMWLDNRNAMLQRVNVLRMGAVASLGVGARMFRTRKAYRAGFAGHLSGIN